jgi:hypothetical protein
MNVNLMIAYSGEKSHNAGWIKRMHPSEKEW